MKRRVVRYTDDASDDLEAIMIQFAIAAGPDLALNYVERIVSFCNKLDIAAERGGRRDDILPGLRIVGFERRATIAFTVEADQVWIQRIFYGGRDWEAELSEE